MKENKLRYHIDHDLPLLSTRLWSTQPFFWEAIGATGTFDYVEFVAEYAPYDFTDLPNMARAAELNDMASYTYLTDEVAYVPGEVVPGEVNEEYHVDEAELQKLLVKMFYKEV